MFKRIQAQPTVRDRILMVPAEMPEEDFEADERPAAVSLSEWKENAPVPKLTVANVPSKKAVQVEACRLYDLKPGIGYPVMVQGKSLALFREGDDRIFVEIHG